MAVETWPMCCGARQLVRATPYKKVQDWQEDYLDDDEYGFLAVSISRIPA
jgi:hypothetical protein